MKPMVILEILLIALAGCHRAGPAANGAGGDMAHARARAEISRTLGELNLALESLDLARIESFHHYGPQFTRVQNGRRLNADEGRELEREYFGSVDRFASTMDDVKIDVFGDAAIVTAAYEWEGRRGADVNRGAALLTLGLARMEGGWKIVHEGICAAEP